MSLNDLINIQISASGNLPSQAGFGVPLIADYHTHYNDRVRYYSAQADLLTDGFTVTSEAYKAAGVIMAQNPTVTRFAVGRRANPDLQVLVLTLTSASALDVYTATFVDQAGASHSLSIASTGVPATDAATLATAITGYSLAGCTVTHTGATITLTHTAGNYTDIQNWAPLASTPILQLHDATVDPGLAADLAAILAADAGWYGLCLSYCAPATILVAATFVETNRKIGAFHSSDTGIELGTAGNVALLSLAAGYSRSWFEYARVAVKSYDGPAALGRNLPPAPGSITWAYKNLVLVPSSNLSETVINNLTAAGWNYFTTYKGSRVSLPGVSPSGEFMDLVQGIDWFQDLSQTNLFGLLVGNGKVAFTDKGGDQILSVLKQNNQLAVGAGFADPGDDTTPAPTATVPLVADISVTNRAKRLFVGSKFAFKLAGAIQSLTLTGTLTP